jgi:predicted transcriptional regulator
MTNTAREKPAEYRLNARLDAKHARKLEALARATGVSVSDVIRDAIDHYHAAKAGVTPKGRKALDKLAGIAQGPADLSSQYKRYLAKDLSTKHGDR